MDSIIRVNEFEFEALIDDILLFMVSEHLPLQFGLTQDIVDGGGQCNTTAGTMFSVPLGKEVGKNE